MAHGCSFGAFHAVNIAFRHPHQFGRLLAFSGKYDMSNFFGGYYDDNIYFNSPSHFLPNLADRSTLDAMRRMDIIIAIGREDPNIEDNRRLSRRAVAEGRTATLFASGTAGATTGPIGSRWCAPTSAAAIESGGVYGFRGTMPRQRLTPIQRLIHAAQVETSGAKHGRRQAGGR